MMIIIIIIIAVLIGASQLLFIFLNMEDEATEEETEYRFEVAKMRNEKVDIFALGDRFPSKSVYTVNIRKGVI